MLLPEKVLCSTKLRKVHDIQRLRKIWGHNGRNLFCYIGLEQSKNLINHHKNVSQTHQHGVNSMINVFPVVEVIINVWSYTDSVMT